LPLFETAALKYAWLNNAVAVGVYRPDLGKIAYSPTLRFQEATTSKSKGSAA
jgi:hypothetical protein